MSANDSALASGMSGDGMFANNTSDEATHEAESKEQQQLLELLPTAEKELEIIDAELEHTNTLGDFFAELGCRPTDLPESDIRAKLEARYGYVDYLLGRRAQILSALEAAGKEMDQYTLLPPKFAIPVKTVTVHEPRPRGWRSIVAGIRDLFGRPPMK